MNRRQFVRLAGAGLVAGAAGCSGGRVTVAGGPTAVDAGRGDGPSITSPAFEEREPIPTKYTCDGADVSPPLRFGDVPEAAASLALVVDDPDAPGGSPFVHWLLWNVPPDTTTVPAGIPQEPTVDALGGAVQGTNDFGELGYRGPCPPEGPPHTYRFIAHAVDATLDLDPGTKRGPLADRLAEHSIGTTTLRGTYRR